MKILFCSSEVVPFAKTGGLADVSGALPIALEKQGVEVNVCMPKYGSIKEQDYHIKKLDDKVSYCKIGKKIKVYFIANENYFNRSGLYGDKIGDYVDNLDRFVFYSRETLNLLKQINFKPDIIHCNDWQTSLIPVYLKTIYSKDSFYKKIKTLLTIHNLAYQGLFGKDQYPKLGLDWSLFNIDGLEFYDKINILKGGIVFSDLISTVSEAYAKEIQTKEFGCGLEGILLKRKKSLSGIINGLDYELWDPAIDNLIFKKYSPETLDDKFINKKKLQEECGLEQNKNALLFGFVGRLAEQKGIDIITNNMDTMFKSNIQMVILGTGDQKYHEILEKLSLKYAKKFALYLKFDNTIAHKIYAGSDIFLMPSRYEPCGLGQMISFKYATVPLAFKTGGLADTIVDLEKNNSKGNGFLFDKYEAKAFMAKFNKAVSIHKDKNAWGKILKRIVKLDFSWQESAKKYKGLYKKCLLSG
jgi:starch synthase